MGEIIQIPPNDTRFSYRKVRVDVCILEDDRILVVYKGSVIAESKLSKNNKVIEKERKIEDFLNSREYVPSSL